eukprot:TRINITY_DN11202_c0_g1_i1.p1 TRINITY_DN11202_c0_g1~~TRINITY_DN11202_c0_g1_i1.p1  ORF type:complete len:189 (-),score=30.65 TRINITY_DN11202_c0_g1_i1:66-632(-)
MNNFNAFKILADKPGTLSCRDKNGLSLLESAGEQAGNEYLREPQKTAAQDILKYLEEMPECKAQKDMIEFGKACEAGDEEKVREMMERGDIDVNGLYRGYPFLCLAVKENQSSVVALLLSDEKTRLDVRVLYYQSQETILHIVQDTELLKLLLQDSRCTPEILNAKDEKGETPLFKTAEWYGIRNYDI